MNTRSRKMTDMPSSSVPVSTEATSKKKGKTTRKLTKPAEQQDNNGNDPEPRLAPTAVMYKRKSEQKLHEAKKKQRVFTEEIRDLTKERDSLLQQVGQTTDDGGTIDTSSSVDLTSDETLDPPSKSSSSSTPSSSSSSSSTSSSDSSSSTDSSDSDKKSKKRRKKKKKKHHHKSSKRNKEKRKKKEKNKQHGKQRARHPKEVIKRYKTVLKAYKKGRKLSAAYQKVGVDRNTVVNTAPICELATVAPDKYKQLLEAFTPKQRLGDFTKKCMEVLINDPNLLRDVENQKKKGKLIPLYKKA